MRRSVSVPDMIDSTASSSSPQAPRVKITTPTVLVVDDSAFNLKVVSRVVADMFVSVRVVTAQNGREGVQKYKELRASEPEEELALIVMDYNMPCVDGVTAARYIRALEAMNMGEEFKHQAKGEGSNASSQSNDGVRDSTDRGEKYRRIPIVMYTTELHVVLPALIEGIIDDRIPKICSKDTFHATLERHLPEKYHQFVKPYMGLDRDRAHSENDVGDIMLETTGTWDLDEMYDSLGVEPAVARAHGLGKRSRTGASVKNKTLKRGEHDGIINLNSEAPKSRFGFLSRFPKSLKKLFNSKNKTSKSGAPRSKLNDLHSGGKLSGKAGMFARVQSEDYSHHKNTRM
jgi:CheY-like chemotaxis protein